MKTAKITEIFSSIQGEGPYIGEEQLFIRFYRCLLGCNFCDENKKTVFSEYCIAEVLEEITKAGIKTVSLTGGEPLNQVSFLKKLLPILKEKTFKTYLETNGTLKDALLEVLDYVDVISMDFKLPSSTGLRPYWDEHYDFLKAAVKREVFVKSVVSPETTLSDIKEAVFIIKAVDKNILFIIQPVSYNSKVPKIDLLFDFFRVAKSRLTKVRVIPQMHKILGTR